MSWDDRRSKEMLREATRGYEYILGTSQRCVIILAQHVSVCFWPIVTNPHSITFLHPSIAMHRYASLCIAMHRYASVCHVRCQCYQLGFALRVQWGSRPRPTLQAHLQLGRHHGPLLSLPRKCNWQTHHTYSIIFIHYLEINCILYIYILYNYRIIYYRHRPSMTIHQNQTSLLLRALFSAQGLAGCAKGGRL